MNAAKHSCVSLLPYLQTGQVFMNLIRKAGIRKPDDAILQDNNAVICPLNDGTVFFLALLQLFLHRMLIKRHFNGDFQFPLGKGLRMNPAGAVLLTRCKFQDQNGRSGIRRGYQQVP